MKLRLINMSMFPKIRVYIQKEYFDLYSDWRDLVGRDMHELFFLCVCLGYKTGKDIPLSKKVQKFWSDTFDAEEWNCFYAIFFKKHQIDPTSIMDAEKVFKFIEGYANGGMEILIDELLTDFTIGDPDNLRIDSSSSKGLAKSILAYISETAQ